MVRSDRQSASADLVSEVQQLAIRASRPDELHRLDAAIEAETDDVARGSLLLGRAIARQGDADPSGPAADSGRAFELLAAGGRLGDAALAAAVAGGMRHRAGDLEAAVDYAVEAMVLVDIAQRSPVAGRAANALAVLFAQLSAFEQAVRYSDLAATTFGHAECIDNFAVTYTHCYVAVEARHAGLDVALDGAHRCVEQLALASHPLARQMLGPGMAAELHHLEHPNDPPPVELDPAALEGAAPRLRAWYRLVLAVAACQRGDHAAATELLDIALPALLAVGDDHRVVRAYRLRSAARLELGDVRGALDDTTAVGELVRTWQVQQVGRLAAQISRRAELEKVRSTLQQEADLLARQVDIDSLTQTGSRHLLEIRLDQLAVGQGRVAVALLDVDEFKRVNDDYGHAAGDAVLRRLGDVLRAAARSSSVLARYGGDEFVAVFEDADASAAVAFADEVRTMLAATDWDAVASGLTVRVRRRRGGRRARRCPCDRRPRRRGALHSQTSRPRPLRHGLSAVRPSDRPCVPRPAT